MTPEPCRFDYAVWAIEALQLYIDNCAAEVNTLNLLNQAESAIHDLQRIENIIPHDSKRIRKPKKSVSTLFTEFKEKYDALQPLITHIDFYLNTHKKTFSDIKKLSAGIKNIEDTHNQLTRINAEFARVEKAISRCAPKKEAENESNA